MHEKIEIKKKNGQKVPLGIGIVKLYNKLHQAAMIARPSNRNQKIISVLLNIKFCTKNFKFRKMVPLGIGIVKLYKKCHQAVMIGKASSRNQKILSVFAENIKIFTKNSNF